MRRSRTANFPHLTASLRTLVAVACITAPRLTFAQDTGASAATLHDTLHDTLRVYYVGKAVGHERYALTSTARQHQLSATLDYVDRGRRVRAVAAMDAARDWSMRRLEIARGGDSLTRDVRVVVDGTGARVETARESVTLRLAGKGALAVIGHAPASQHLALLRYWAQHGRPGTLRVITGAAVNTVTIAHAGRDTIAGDVDSGVLDRYTIEGVSWGRETAWVDRRGRLAGLATRAGNLTFQAVRVALEPHYERLMAIAAGDRMRELAALRVPPVADGWTGTVALTGATVIDATGAPPMGDMTVVVERGRIVAVGRSASVAVPPGARAIDVGGKTILPGLWDMHAHLTQVERAPGYLAVGVTTARDMGSEVDFIVRLRETVRAGATGPHLLLAGLVDGGGPNAFGPVDATTPDEGRAVARRYHSLGFEQLKLYNLLRPDVVGAMTREAHALGMTVTGHVPNALGLKAAVDSGQDQVAHLAIAGDPGADSVRALARWLAARETVFDPTPSWNELNLHHVSEPVAQLVPGVGALPPVLAQRIEAMGSTGDSAQARARITRSLALIRVLHDAGVPIVAGTDMGVPGYSVYREMELYEAAGLSRMDAIRTATAVPARVMGMGNDVGTIEVGKRADLIVLDRNPLDDLRNLYSLQLVMKEGVLYRRDDVARAIGFRPEALGRVAGRR